MFTGQLSDRQPPATLPADCYAAWQDALEGHRGQIRTSDQEPYIAHPEAVATVVGAWGWSPSVIKVALLHDVLEDSEMGLSDLAKKHGPEGANAVAVLSKDKTLPKTDQGPEAKCRLALSLPRVGPAVGLVKLVDRAHNMTTAQHLSRDKQRAMVSDAHYFFAPLARQLGLNRLANWFEACCPAQLGWADHEFVLAMQSFAGEAHPKAVMAWWRAQVLNACRLSWVSGDAQTTAPQTH